MPKYVDVQKLTQKRFLTDCQGVTYGTRDYVFFNEIEALPEEDVTPVIHAYWKILESGSGWCSHCGEDTPMGGDTKAQTKEEAKKFKYCTHCGAKMDSEEIK